MTLTVSPEQRWAGILCGLAAALIWGAFPVVTRLGLTRTPLDAYDITCIRYSVSGLILLPYLLRHGRRGLSWTSIGLMVVGIGAPYMLVVAQGLALAPVELFAVVTPGSMILLSILISARLFGTRLGARANAGTALIIGGVLLAGWHSFAGAQASPYAYLMFLLGGLLWAIYTLVSKWSGSAALHATAIVSVCSMVLYLPPYLGSRGLRILQAPLWDIGIQVVYQGLLVSTVALFFYSRSVQLLGAALGSTFAALVPGTAMVLAALLLGERADNTAIAGLLVVTAGMLLTLLPQRPRPLPGAIGQPTPRPPGPTP
ncbi:DMT family transporter [Pseudomonas chlororaphis]|uniref:DMT family transporter n=1 Tax=Pseudomonas chlororaphis TaxID=587753 RepID=UPI0006A5B84C|nr:DMT family transporter [Pseudomonas chlororaphis]AZD02837.1 Permease of the drug/metabolite transporter (DMT) superfamily [Pseudomonas chlororaphis subsp. chlororaphis]MBM0280862.1 DMT family transporter [Pseudomonas chlororaphis]MDO1504497.1 DMT family transporter [Pseudomonas chlororaphis]ORM44742.1 EamA family transporter [Pseudomonas chlororaphis subsp. chlororaphis]TWR95639.1 DMT family transporter [Pseudomonas chlororaphis subsp. chlororaphis]